MKIFEGTWSEYRQGIVPTDKELVLQDGEKVYMVMAVDFEDREIVDIVNVIAEEQFPPYIFLNGQSYILGSKIEIRNGEVRLMYRTIDKIVRDESENGG